MLTDDIYAATAHDKFQLDVLTNEPRFLSGASVRGVVQTTCTSSNLHLGDVKIELLGKEELTSLEHVAQEIFLHQTVIIQDMNTLPSNAVDPTRDLIPPNFYLARKGKTRFSFTFKLPRGLPSSCSFGNNAQCLYVLKATAQLLYQGKRAHLVKFLTIHVLEQWSDWSDEQFWASVKRNTSERLPSSSGSVSLEASIQPALHWKDDNYDHAAGPRKSAQDLLPVALCVKNTTNRQLGDLRIHIIRRLQTPSENDQFADNKVTAPLVSETVISDQLKSQSYDFRPGQERDLVVHAQLPDNIYSFRGKRLFDINIIVRIVLKLSSGLSIGKVKEAVLELPIWLADSLSMPPEAVAHRSSLLCNQSTYQDYQPTLLRNPYSPPPIRSESRPVSPCMSPWSPGSFSPAMHPSPSPNLHQSSSTPLPYSIDQLHMNLDIPPYTPSKFLAGLGISSDHGSQSNDLKYSATFADYAVQDPIQRPTSARSDNRASPSPILSATPALLSSPIRLPPALQASLSVQDQRIVLHNLVPQPPYVGGDRVGMNSAELRRSIRLKRHSAPVYSTPPPVSPSAQYIDMFATEMSQMSNDAATLDTIGEDGESQAGTIRVQNSQMLHHLANLSSSSDPEIKSCSAIRALGLPGSTSASRLEDLVNDQDWPMNKTLPKVPRDQSTSETLSPLQTLYDPTKSDTSSLIQFECILPPSLLSRSVSKSVSPSNETDADHIRKLSSVRTYKSLSMSNLASLSSSADQSNKAKEPMKLRSCAKESLARSDTGLLSLQRRLTRRATPPSHSTTERPSSTQSNSGGNPKQFVGALRAKSSLLSLSDQLDLSSRPIPRSVSDPGRDSGLSPKRPAEIGACVGSPRDQTSPARNDFIKDPVSEQANTPSCHMQKESFEEETKQRAKSRKEKGPDRPLLQTKTELPVLLKEKESNPDSKVARVFAKEDHIETKKEIGRSKRLDEFEGSPQYNVKSARGGKGGKVTDLTKLWKCMTEKDEEAKDAIFKLPNKRMVSDGTKFQLEEVRAAITDADAQRKVQPSRTQPLASVSNKSPAVPQYLNLSASKPVMAPPSVLKFSSKRGASQPKLAALIAKYDLQGSR